MLTAMNRKLQDRRLQVWPGREEAPLAEIFKP